MIHPTRTNLLALKDKARSVLGSIGILKGRRQMLIHELLEASRPLLQSRETTRRTYAEAIFELHLSLGHEGEAFIASLLPVSTQDLGIEIVPRNIMGLRYRDLTVQQDPVRSPEDREYDYTATTSHMEEAIHRFETIVSEMLEMAAFEGKLKRISEELIRVTRRIRVLEERILPGIRGQIRTIIQYLSEREREAYYGLKLFKKKAERAAKAESV